MENLKAGGAGFGAGSGDVGDLDMEEGDGELDCLVAQPRGVPSENGRGPGGREKAGFVTQISSALPNAAGAAAHSGFRQQRGGNNQAGGRLQMSNREFFHLVVTRLYYSKATGYTVSLDCLWDVF